MSALIACSSSVTYDMLGESCLELQSLVFDNSEKAR